MGEGCGSEFGGETADMVMDLVMDAMDGPFVWGRSDCCTCACDVFKALHGIDPMASMRGRYTTKTEAYRLIKSQGGWVEMFKTLAAESGLILGEYQHKTSLNPPKGVGDVFLKSLLRQAGNPARVEQRSRGGVRDRCASPRRRPACYKPAILRLDRRHRTAIG